MRILKNITGEELNRLTSQPTAKKLNELIKSADLLNNAKTDVEISSEAKELQQIEAAKKAPDMAFDARRIGDSNKFTISFKNSAMLNRALKQGYIEVEGKQVVFSDEVKKQLTATDKQIQNAKKAVSMHNMLLREAANSRRSSDAMKAANDKTARAMQTASRIMHGRKVSPADEKELMEFNKDLYTMAKSAAALEKHRRKKSEDNEDDKISAQNEEARAREKEPKDYSVEEAPTPRNEAQIDISFEGAKPEITAVGAGLPLE